MGCDYDQYFKLSDIILNIPTGLDESKYAVMTDSLCSRLTFKALTPFFKNTLCSQSS